MAEYSSEAMVTHASRQFVEEIKPILDDAHFQQMKSAFTATGRGRPPKLQLVPLTNKLLLQLDLLRLETGRDWSDLVSFLPKVFDVNLLQGLEIKAEIEGTVKEATKLGNKTGLELEAFLDVDAGRCIMGRNVGVHLLKHRITRNHLLNPDLLEDLDRPSELVNGMVLDLISFHKKENLSLTSCRQTLTFLGADVDALSDPQLNAKLNHTFTKCRSLGKSINRPGRQEKLNIFLSQPCDFSLLTLSTPTPLKDAWHTPNVQKLSATQRQLSSQRRCT
ncbi:hypothetical protein V1264_018470 [Littorina saxatilis]|uniref:Uncharacterized protein n=1 Tax=Littorina saxatilis TaxID=31220 RepID=A0AAN9BDS9_9CAEN